VSAQPTEGPEGVARRWPARGFALRASRPLPLYRPSSGCPVGHLLRPRAVTLPAPEKLLPAPLVPP